MRAIRFMLSTGAEITSALRRWSEVMISDSFNAEATSSSPSGVRAINCSIDCCCGLWLTPVGSGSPVSATLFYQEQLSGQGWTEEAVTVFNEKANLVFSKEAQHLTVIINPDQTPEKIKVVVNLQE